MEAPSKYAALWRADVEFESKLLAAVPMSSVAEHLKPLLTEGWRPFAIAMDVPQSRTVVPTVPEQLGQLFYTSIAR